MRYPYANSHSPKLFHFPDKSSSKSHHHPSWKQCLSGDSGRNPFLPDRLWNFGCRRIFRSANGYRYNPYTCAHPYHAGDLPPIFGVNGYGFSMFLTNRFSAGEIIGRTIILHSMPDDFTSQPAGNSGAKIACGTIVAQ